MENKKTGAVVMVVHYPWTPTPENVNQLPDPIRLYIHDLETNAGNADLIQENAALRERCSVLECYVTNFIKKE